MLEVEVGAFDRWRQAVEFGPTIAALYGTSTMSDTMRSSGTVAGLQAMTPEQRSVVLDLTRSVIQKVLHTPIVSLKSAAQRGEAGPRAALYREIFGFTAKRPAAPPDDADADADEPRSRPDARDSGRKGRLSGAPPPGIPWLTVWHCGRRITSPTGVKTAWPGADGRHHDHQDRGGPAHRRPVDRVGRKRRLRQGDRGRAAFGDDRSRGPQLEGPSDGHSGGLRHRGDSIATRSARRVGLPLGAARRGSAARRARGDREPAAPVPARQRAPGSAGLRSCAETSTRGSPKLDEGQFDALILAVSGIERLGLTHAPYTPIPSHGLPPRAGTGRVRHRRPAPTMRRRGRLVAPLRRCEMRRRPWRPSARSSRSSAPGASRRPGRSRRSTVTG